MTDHPFELVAFLLAAGRLAEATSLSPGVARSLARALRHCWAGEHAAAMIALPRVETLCRVLLTAAGEALYRVQTGSKPGRHPTLEICWTGWQPAGSTRTGIGFSAHCLLHPASDGTSATTDSTASPTTTWDPPSPRWCSSPPSSWLRVRVGPEEAHTRPRSA
jgi:hypothetical protein